jgi:hypothetical protein
MSSGGTNPIIKKSFQVVTNMINKNRMLREIQTDPDFHSTRPIFHFACPNQARTENQSPEVSNSSF